MLAASSHFEMLDIYWPMYLFYFSLPAVQYPSPLHGHRWITRPGLAQLTEWCCSSENTPLPSYSNGLSAGCPLARRGTQKKIGRDVGGKEGGEVLRWDWSGLMRRRELLLSLGETGMPTVRCSADTGIRSFRNSTQPLHTNCSSPSADPPHFPLPFLFYALIEAGWRKL